MTALVTVVVITAVNRTTDSDPMGSLLAAESLVQGHWLSLDHYSDLVKTSLGYRTEMVNGRLFYSFPIGTSILVAPVIGMLGLAGTDIAANDDTIQTGLAAVAAVGAFLLAYFLARRFQRHWISLLLASAFWFGSALSSSGGTALWSHDFGVVFSLAALLALEGALRRHAVSNAAWSGVLSGCAVLVRPQLAPLVLGIAIVMTLRWRRGLAAFVPSLVAVAIAFITLSLLTSGQWIPGYYLPQRLSGGEFWEALGANLVSPGRGFLLFTPIVLILLLLLPNWRGLTSDDQALAVLGLSWAAVHLLAISRFPHWWGGWGYGPRLMMDVLPGVFLALVVLWPRDPTRRRAKVTVAAFLVMAVISIWINTIQGLYNPYTRFWYIEPNIEAQPSMVWDWSYPQFLASEKGHEARLQRQLPTPPSIQPGVDYPPEAPELGFVGWSTGFWSNGISLDSFQYGPPPWRSEDGRRWTEGSHARLVLSVDSETRTSLAGQFRIAVDSLGSQKVNISLNGVPVYEGITGGNRAVLTFDVDPGLLRPGVNELDFDLPSPTLVGQGSEFRELAIALRQFTVR
jgi:hypothetical protein